jgi:hypothetical protein
LLSSTADIGCKHPDGYGRRFFRVTAGSRRAS